MIVAKKLLSGLLVLVMLTTVLASCKNNNSVSNVTGEETSTTLVTTPIQTTLPITTEPPAIDYGTLSAILIKLLSLLLRMCTAKEQCRTRSDIPTMFIQTQTKH